MEARLFQTNKSVKILVLSDEEFLFDLEKKELGELLKNDITYAGIFRDVDEKDLLNAVRPDIIIEFAAGETPSIQLDVTSSRVIPRIQNVDANMLKNFHEIFLLIDQIKQIQSQLKID